MNVCCFICEVFILLFQSSLECFNSQSGVWFQMFFMFKVNIVMFCLSVHFGSQIVW